MPNETKYQPVNISTLTILKVIFIILALLFLYLIRDILIIIFIALVVASGVNPWVDWFQKRGLPRAIGILMIYLVLIAIFSLAIVLLIPPVTEQFRQIASDFPTYYEKIVAGFASLQQFSVEHGLVDDIQRFLDTINQNLVKLTGGIFSTAVSIFGGFFSLLGILVITFYMTIQEKGIKKFFDAIAPIKYKPYLIQKGHQIQEKMGLWLRGQLLLCVIIGVMSYVGLLILGVKYALILGLIAGLTEFIPFIGPIVGAIPAVFLALFQSPVKALLVVILYIVIQQLENNIVVPKVMQRTVGLNPIVVIVAMLIGVKIAGILGVILAVPAATIIAIFLKDFFEEKKLKEERLE